MTVYWIACITSIGLTWLVTRQYTLKGHEFQGRLYWFIAILIAAAPYIYIAAIRYNVGADFFSYYKYYVRLLNGGTTRPVTGFFTRQRGQYEIFYYLTNLVLAHFHLSPQWMLAVCACLFLLPVYKRIIDDSPYPEISVFLLMAMGYYCFFLNGTRQMIAAGFLMLSIPFIAKKKLIPFLILVFVATGFHTTSIVFLAVYLVAYFNIGVKLLTAVTIILFAFGNIFGSLANSFIGKLNYYSDFLDSNAANQGQGYMILFINIILVIFATIYYQKDNKLYQVYYSLQVFALWASALTGKIVLVMRFRMVFGLPSIVLVPMAISGIENKKTRRIIGTLIIILYFIYATYTIGFQNANSVLPYQTYWQAGGIQ